MGRRRVYGKVDLDGVVVAGTGHIAGAGLPRPGFDWPDRIPASGDDASPPASLLAPAAVVSRTLIGQ